MIDARQDLGIEPSKIQLAPHLAFPANGELAAGIAYGHAGGIAAFRPRLYVPLVHSGSLMGWDAIGPVEGWMDTIEIAELRLQAQKLPAPLRVGLPRRGVLPGVLDDEVKGFFDRCVAVAKREGWRWLDRGFGLGRSTGWLWVAPERWIVRSPALEAGWAKGSGVTGAGGVFKVAEHAPVSRSNVVWAIAWNEKGKLVLQHRQSSKAYGNLGDLLAHVPDEHFASALEATTAPQVFEPPAWWPRGGGLTLRRSSNAER